MTDLDSWNGALHRGLGWVARWPGVIVVIPADASQDASAEQLLNELGRDPTVDQVRQTVAAFTLRGALRAVAYVARDPGTGALVGYACGATEVIGAGKVAVNGTGPLREEALEPGDRITIRAANLSNAARPAPLFDLRLGVAPGAGITLTPVGVPLGAEVSGAVPRMEPPPGRPDDLPRPLAPSPPVEPALVAAGALRPEPPTGALAAVPMEVEPFAAVLLHQGPGLALPALDPLPVARPLAPEEAQPSPGPLGHPAPSHRLPQPDLPIADDDVVVEGILCSRHHFNNPGASYCMVCGISMVHLTHNLVPGPRPTLGFVVFDNGSTYGLDRSYVVGREPGQLSQANTAPLAIHDDNETLSRRHAEIRLIGWDVHIVDLGSTNGTFVWDLSFQRWNQIAPHQPVALSPGDTVALGRRTFVYESVTRL